MILIEVAVVRIPRFPHLIISRTCDNLPYTENEICILILNSMSCLYILESKLLSTASFANIFSHSEGCLFLLFMISFAVHKLLIM